jgi:hypothetical protein
LLETNIQKFLPTIRIIAEENVEETERNDILEDLTYEKYISSENDRDYININNFITGVYAKASNNFM